METVAKTAEDKIRRGIISLQNPQPFFAYLLMLMRPKLFPPEAPMQTMGVNAKGELFYAKEFAEGLTEEEMNGALCHETLHVALLHMLRTGNRQRQIANIAQDVTVNMMVVKSGMILPKDTIAVDEHNDTSDFQLGKTRIHIADVTEKTWEEIYAEIMDQLHKNNDSSSGKDRKGIGFDDHIQSDEPLTTKEQQQLQQKWSGAIADAATYAKQKGKLPAGMSRIIDELLKPQVYWKAMLLKYLRPYLSPVDWSYQRPHKKSQVLEVFLPTTLKEHSEVEVIVDTSGSISKDELQEFVAEIVGIAKSMTHITMHVSFVDAAVNSRYEINNVDIPKILAMEPKGGGGTSMEVGLDYVKEHNREVPVVIVLTDGFDSWERTRMDYPFDVIWVINKSGISVSNMKKIPYGISIKMD